MIPKVFFQKKGSTLIELLVVVLIITALAFSLSLIIPNQIKKARDARRKSDLEKIKIALYDYYFDHDCFPLNLVSCGENFQLGSQIYLSQFPCDPTGGDYGYQVENSACPQWFKALANLERIQDPGIELVGCQAGCGPNCEYNYGLSSTNIKVNKGCVTYYACAKGKAGEAEQCVAFDDPWCSLCPEVFENDPTCGGGCDCQINRNCCHDERGKFVPEGQICVPAGEEED